MGFLKSLFREMEYPGSAHAAEQTDLVEIEPAPPVMVPKSWFGLFVSRGRGLNSAEYRPEEHADIIVPPRTGTGPAILSKRNPRIRLIAPGIGAPATVSRPRVRLLNFGKRGE